MLKLRRNVNQTLQGAPPSCESPRVLPLARPCVPAEDVPPTRIPRTARDGAQSVTPLATTLTGACASPSRCASTSPCGSMGRVLIEGRSRGSPCRRPSPQDFQPEEGCGENLGYARLASRHQRRSSFVFALVVYSVPGLDSLHSCGVACERLSGGPHKARTFLAHPSRGYLGNRCSRGRKKILLAAPAMSFKLFMGMSPF